MDECIFWIVKVLVNGSSSSSNSKLYNTEMVQKNNKIKIKTINSDL